MSMKESLFDGARFDDKFVTRDGRKAIYLRATECPKHELAMHMLIVEDGTLISVTQDGLHDYKHGKETKDDIVNVYYKFL